MNVFSGFDGMSCAQIALNKLGITPAKYYAAEIDKYAIQVTQANYPNTIQMGDITKWREWDIDWSTIDLFVGGSPCQGFSFAGQQAGTAAILNGEKIIISNREEYLSAKAAGAEFLSQSYLFWEYLLCLDHVKKLNPRVKFMLENVRMKKMYFDLINDAIGLEPVFINSNLVSAQNRQRFYWANWAIEQPEDKGIFLRDILETEPFEKTIMSDKFTAGNAHILRDDLTGKAKSLSAMEYVKNGRQGDYIAIEQTPRGNNSGGLRALDGKTPTLSANCWEHNNKLVTGCYEHGARGLQQLDSGKSYAITATAGAGGKALVSVKSASRRGRGDEVRKDDKCGALLSDGHQSRWLAKYNILYRKLTPRECGRLQTVPEKIIDKMLSCGVSNTQLYKMLGNGWTVDVVAHIFSQMQLPIQVFARQLDMFKDAA